MNREIKFRAYIPKGWKGMIGDCWVVPTWISGNGEYVGLIGTTIEVAKSSVKIVEYTGLLDKAGKEIYEGDICTDVKKEIRVVKYSAGEWSWSYYEYPEDDWTVIGNIYENPELIKE